MLKAVVLKNLNLIIFIPFLVPCPKMEIYARIGLRLNRFDPLDVLRVQIKHIQQEKEYNSPPHKSLPAHLLENLCQTRRKK
jgi:hypothetical protein